MKVVAYLNGIPKSNSNPDKPKMLLDFIQGVRSLGDQGVVVEKGNPIDCDVAVLQGFVHEHSKDSPHLKLRQAVIDRQRQNGKRFIVIDSNLFLYRNPNSKFFRFSYDGVFPNTGEYCNQNSNSDNWNRIKNKLNFDLQPWKINQGKYVLVCLQRDGGWSMGGLSVSNWLSSIIKEIKQYTDKPIVLRPHPGDKHSKKIAEKSIENGVTLSTRETLLEDLNHAWACITYNSSPGVASAIEGVPTFALNLEQSQASDVSHKTISQLANLQEFDRTQWIQNIAQCHWDFNDMSSGRAWEHMKQWAVK